MKAITYYIALPFIYGISLLSFWWLYRLSDLLYVVLYHLFGYRKQVVARNLANSFPEKTNAELKHIERRFYRYFCDLMLETVKTLTISPRTLRKRLSFDSLAVFDKYKQQDQSIVIVMGHWGNWELGGARFAIEPYHKLYVIYHPLSNKYIDRLVYHMRTRLGNGLYAMKDTLRGMIANRDQLTATAFIADQTPSPTGAYWMEFLHQDTPVFRGTGKIAHKLGYPVVYISIRRVGRGYYRILAEDLVPEPAKSTPEDILVRFTRRLEEDIREIPELWLWSHKRWKHKREVIATEQKT